MLKKLTALLMSLLLCLSLLPGRASAAGLPGPAVPQVQTETVGEQDLDEDEGVMPLSLEGPIERDEADRESED